MAEFSYRSGLSLIWSPFLYCAEFVTKLPPVALGWHLPSSISRNKSFLFQSFQYDPLNCISLVWPKNIHIEPIAVAKGKTVMSGWVWVMSPPFKRGVGSLWERMRVLPKPDELMWGGQWASLKTQCLLINSKGRNMLWVGKNNRCPLHLATAK